VATITEASWPPHRRILPLVNQSEYFDLRECSSLSLSQNARRSPRSVQFASLLVDRSAGFLLAVSRCERGSMNIPQHYRNEPGSNYPPLKICDNVDVHMSVVLTYVWCNVLGNGISRVERNYSQRSGSQKCPRYVPLFLLHTHTHLTALFWDYPGESVPER